MRKRVLITGGAGFIGSHLAERLVGEGHYVIVMDSFYTGAEANISNLTGRDNFELLRHDVRVAFNLEVEQIYNLACPASPIHYQRSPILTVETCVIGPINCLTLAQKVNARVLQASTSEVYGDPQVHPQKEDYWGNVNPIGRRSCYDEGKRVGETVFFDFHREERVDIRVARIFNTYGPRMACGDGRVISNFILQALKNQPVTIYGDGSHTRSFCYVSDMVEALVRMMNTDGITGPINLGCPDERSIKELAELIIELCGSCSSIEYCTPAEDDPVRRRPDISAAREVLGWEPIVSLEDGLRETIEYFENC